MGLDIAEYQVHVVFYVKSGLKDISNSLVPRYTSGSQVYIAPHVLRRLEDTCNISGQKNIFHLMF